MIAFAQLELETDIDLTSHVGLEKQHTINITNTENKTLYDLSFLDLPNFIFPTVGDISGNTTIQYTFSTKTNSSFVENYVSKLSYLKLENVTSVPKTSNITLQSSGISPNIITINKGDTISWYNAESTALTVTEENTEWSISVPPLGHEEKTFNDIANISYFCGIYGGDITVKSNLIEDYLHNPDNDKTVNFNLNSTFAPTTTTVEIFTNSFSIEYDELAEGVGRIKNTGSYTALDLSFSMNWTTFQNNTFNLDAGEEKLIYFIIDPIITKSSQTNKTYDLKLKLSGTNINTLEKDVSVFIRYKQFEDITESKTYTIDEVREMLQDMLNSINLTEENTTTIIYRDKPVVYNITQDEVSTIDDKLTSLEGKTDRTYNSYKSDSDEMKDTVDSIKGDSQEMRDDMDNLTSEVSEMMKNSSTELSKIASDVQARKDKEERERRSGIIWGILKWVLGTMILITLSVSGFLIKVKKNKIKQMVM